MSSEIQIPPETQPSFIKRQAHRAGAALAIAAMGVGGLFAYSKIEEYFDKSGVVTISEPSDPQPAQIDQEFNVGSFNMHNEVASRLEELADFTASQQLDVLALQEVSSDDAELIASAFPDWRVAFVLADTKQEGGYGNVIMARQELKDAKTLALKGDSLEETITKTVATAPDDFKNVLEGDGSFSNSREAMRENRAALAVTVKAYDGNELKEIRVITGHIAPQPDTREQQFKDLLGFVKSNAKDDRPTIFMGDLNAHPAMAILSFAKLGFVVPQTENTIPGKNTVVDYGAYQDGGVLGLGEVRVLKQYRTDHYALVGKWVLQNKD